MQPIVPISLLIAIFVSISAYYVPSTTFGVVVFFASLSYMSRQDAKIKAAKEADEIKAVKAKIDSGEHFFDDEGTQAIARTLLK